jgi:hypothetical protein
MMHVRAVHVRTPPCELRVEEVKGSLVTVLARVPGVVVCMHAWVGSGECGHVVVSPCMHAWVGSGGCGQVVVSRACMRVGSCRCRHVVLSRACMRGWGRVSVAGRRVW